MSFSCLNRKPEAIANAIIMHHNPINVLVEGNSDKKYWSNVFHTDIRIEPCNGYQNVINVSQYLRDSKVVYFSIIDTDFRTYITDLQSPIGDWFTTKEHDLELMMYHSNTFVKLLNNYGINLLMEEKKALCDSIIEIATQIGYLSLADKLVNGELKFKDSDGHKFVFPKYENIMEFKDKKCKYTNDADLYNRIRNFKTNNTKSNWEKVVKMHQNIKSNWNDYDPWQISNGHHVSYLLAFLLRQNLTPNHQHASYDDVEERLYLAFSKDLFKKTTLYKSLEAWEKSHGVTLFANDSEIEAN